MAKLQAPVILVVLDGFALGDMTDPTNAVVQAEPNNFDFLWEEYPHTTLEASGLAVGLPEGQMGNSEVGHLNLGSGRIVYQDLTRITKDIDDHSFYKKPVIQEVYKHAKTSRLQVIGLVSDGNVHCSLDHIIAVIKGAKVAGIEDVYVHVLLDGRDVPPRSAEAYIKQLEMAMHTIGCGTIATISGRYYGMDRDNRWDRVELAYNAIVRGEGPKAVNAITAIEASYANDISDEFVLPTVINSKGCIDNGDAVLFCNFRPDRGRELTKALVASQFDGFQRESLDVYMATMTKYEDGLPVHVVYEKETLSSTLGEVVSRYGYKQLRIAETEKYAHVTYFFNGGVETPFAGEDRILIPSPSVATYDLQPEMSAYEVTDKAVAAIRSKEYDFIILNYANPDMVGHTGNFEATVKAIQAIDANLQRIVDAVREEGWHLLVTADHGNAEMMVNPNTGKPHTAHTTNEVPLILVSDFYKDKGVLTSGKLCDVAPTMLALANIEQPAEMTGNSLLTDQLVYEV